MPLPPPPVEGARGRPGGDTRIPWRGLPGAGRYHIYRYILYECMYATAVGDIAKAYFVVEATTSINATKWLETKGLKQDPNRVAKIVAKIEDSCCHGSNRPAFLSLWLLP